MFMINIFSMLKILQYRLNLRNSYNKISEFPQIKGGLYYEEKWTIRNPPPLKTLVFLSIAHSFFPKSSHSLTPNSQAKP